MIDTKALRQKILDMAIKGKLVPQDPNDEPASVLLERIRAEKQQLIKEGKIKKDKHDSVIFKGDDNRYYEKVGSEVKDITEDLPFEIPDSWVWTGLDKAVIINPRNNLTDDVEVSFVEMKAILDGYTNQFIATNRLWKEVKCGFTHFQESDVGFAKITPCFQNRKSVVFTNLRNGYGAGTTELHVLRPIQRTIVPNYLLYFVKSSYFIEHGEQRFSGTAGQQRFGTDEVKKTLFPLPPLAEQARIVERIEELFTQVDAIEQNQADIDTLYDEFRKRTLTLAIQGKLVPQDPNDEPASVLLERIRAEKKAKLGKKFVDSYIYKGDDNCYYEHIAGRAQDEPVEVPFDIPDNWEWSKIKYIADTQTGTTPSTSDKSNFGDYISFVKPGDLVNGRILYNREMLSERGLNNGRLIPSNSVIMVCIGGSTGKCALTDRDISCNQQINTASPCKWVLPQYLFFFMTSDYFYKTVRANATGTATPIINRSTWENLVIPIPPLAEQKRIVAKINDIFAML